THPARLPVKKGMNTVELRLPEVELSYNAYFLSLKAYTKNNGPDWKDPADVHNQMYQFDVLTDHVIHGLMQFDAEWRGVTACPDSDKQRDSRTRLVGLGITLPTIVLFVWLQWGFGASSRRKADTRNPPNGVASPSSPSPPPPPDPLAAAA